MTDRLTKLDVFISSPGDVVGERECALEVIKQLNNLSVVRDRFVLKPLAYERRVPPVVGAGPQEVVDRYMEEAGKADIFVCILWHRMGTLTLDPTSGTTYDSGTEYEFTSAYRATLEHGTPTVLLYRKLAPPGEDVDPSQSQKVSAFFERFVGTDADFAGLFKDFDSVLDFRGKLLQDLDAVLSTEFIHIDSTAAEQALGFYRHIPLPIHFVPRPDVVDDVRSNVLEESSTVVALHGMPGAGKSAIARAVCEDSQIQAAFPDGILWTVLGSARDQSLEPLLKAWIQTLHGSTPPGDATVPQLANQLAKILERRSCLLIVDDVWFRDHLDPFAVAGPMSRLLFTTRDAVLAREYGARVVRVPPMRPAAAVELLKGWAQNKLDSAPTEQLERIVERLEHLPLAIKLAGSQLIDDEPVNWLAGFGSLDELDAGWQTTDRNSSVAACFELSLRALEKKEPAATLYMALGVFADGAVMLAETVDQLWMALHPGLGKKAARLRRHLADQALINLDDGGISLHGLLAQFTRERRDGDPTELDRALVEAHRPQGGGGWAAASLSHYMEDYLAHHLARAHLIEDATGLFASPRWRDRRTTSSGGTYGGFVRDMVRVWSIFQATPEQKGALSQLARLTLIIGGLNSHVEAVAPALVRRALELELWTPLRALDLLCEPGSRGVALSCVRRCFSSMAFRPRCVMRRKSWHWKPWEGARSSMSHSVVLPRWHPTCRTSRRTN